jgi:endoglucanase
MKALRVLLACMFLGCSFLYGLDTRISEADIFAANKKLGRGINFGNALEAPNEGQWGVTLKPEYFQAIKAVGFDSVRLPTKWSSHVAIEPPYTLDAKFADRVAWAVDQATANRLNIILNVQHYEELDSHPEDHAQRMVGIWENLAERYRDRPDSVYFELYNEPHDKLTEAKWNELVPRLLHVVRKTNPTRPVIIGPGQWNAVRALNRLELPSHDRNIIVTIHCYDPFHFTHQGASWAKGSEQWKGTKWTGTQAEQDALRKTLTQAAEWGKKHNRPIFLGEFGAYQEADLDSRIRWTRFVAREAENLGMSWAYWEFCAGFGAFDPQKNTWRRGLKEALIDTRK